MYVHTHFSHHLESYNLLALMLSGFWKLHSRVISLLHVTDKWLENVDEDFVTCIIFIDLRKAFDAVSILILMKNLPKFGLELEWFESHLIRRSQCVYVLMDNFLMSSCHCRSSTRIHSGPLAFYPVFKWHTQCVKTLW